MGEHGLVYVCYWERCKGEDVNPKTVYPVTRECVGWLDYEDHNFVRVIYDRFVSPTAEAGLSELRAMCKAIPKADVIDMQVLPVNPKLRG